MIILGFPAGWLFGVVRLGQNFPIEKQKSTDQKSTVKNSIDLPVRILYQTDNVTFVLSYPVNYITIVMVVTLY